MIERIGIVSLSSGYASDDDIAKAVNEFLAKTPGELVEIKPIPTCIDRQDADWLTIFIVYHPKPEPTDVSADGPGRYCQNAIPGYRMAACARYADATGA